MLLTIAIGKVAVLLVIFLTYNLLPFFAANFDANFVDPAYQDAGIARAFSTWDAQHYLYLSEHGYHAGQESDAFFPLFPLLIRLATPLFRSSLVAGLVVANVASLLGLYFLFELVAGLYGRPAARGTLLLYLAFPTAFFLSLVYSESLFLLLAVLFFYLLLVKRRMAWAAVPAALLPLARAEGTLILLPFATYYLFEVWQTRYWVMRRALLVLAPLVGVAAYLSFMWAATGNPFEMLQAMSVFVSAHSLTYVLHPSTLAGLLFEHPLAIHGFTNSIIDRAMFLGFVALLVPLFRRVHVSLAVFAVAVGMLNVISGTFMSYSRYLLLAFPIFIAAAMLLRGRQVRWLRMPALYSLVMLQGLLLVMHALGYWVA